MVSTDTWWKRHEVRSLAARDDDALYLCDLNEIKEFSSIAQSIANAEFRSGGRTEAWFAMQRFIRKCEGHQLSAILGQDVIQRMAGR